MVDARRAVKHFVVGHPQGVREHPGGALDAVAEPDGFDAQALQVGAVHRHRVGIIDQQRVRAERTHVLSDLTVRGRTPQKAEHPPRPERVADALVESVAPRNLDVMAVRL